MADPGALPTFEELFAEAVTTVTAQEADALPPPPKLSADKTQQFVADFGTFQVGKDRKLELQQQVVTSIKEQEHRVDAMSKILLVDRRSIDFTRLQNLCRETSVIQSTHRENCQALFDYYEKLLENANRLVVMAMDTVAHRPSQYPLPPPFGLDIQVPVHTPTLGPQVTDEMVLLRNMGLQMSNQ